MTISALILKKHRFSPAINLELIGGPDLFFRVDTTGGVELLSENRSRGRDGDRENAGHCFCVDLCIEEEVPPLFENPQFTHIGDFNITADIDPITGLTNKAKAGHGGPGFGFLGHIKLKGYCPKTLPGDPSAVMFYRFLYIDPVSSAEQAVTGNKVAEAVVGARIVNWDQFGTGIQPTYQDIIIKNTASPNAPDSMPTPPAVPPGTPWGPVPPHVLTPDAQGWIRVDQFAMDGGFYGPLVRLSTATICEWGRSRWCWRWQ